MVSDPKTCSDCGESKPLHDFWDRKRSKDGKDPRCSECARAYHRSIYERPERKQQIRDNNNKRHAKLYSLKDEFLSQSGGCRDCGTTDVRVLTFDHLDPPDKSFSISDAIRNGFSWSRILAEIQKCEVVCANCHMIRTRERIWDRPGISPPSDKRLKE